VSDDVWAERDTTPDDIEAALRSLLRRRHTENPDLVPARVLNLIVVCDRTWKGEISNRLERVGRYRASRTILCAVQDGRDTLDAVMVMDYDETPGGTLGVIHEKVEIDVGLGHLARLDTIVDPVRVSELPTMLWSPHGFRLAVDSLLSLTDVVLLDSDEHDEHDAGLTRASDLLKRVYVVDLAWLRTTPWRERLAACFDTPDRRSALGQLEEVCIRHHPTSAPSAALLAGWLSSRLGWEPSRLAPRNGDERQGDLVADGDRHVRVRLAAFDQEAPGLAGVTVTWPGSSLSLDRGSGGLSAHETFSDGRELSWRVLGASRGEGGILGEGVRQALLRDATYGPALAMALRMCPDGDSA
jgi:glucose-6-phosphate dehydrogenase assembly protein OpcA